MHGEFTQKYFNHVRGQGCPICAARGFDDSIITKEDVNNFFAEKFRKVHGSKYDYSKLNAEKMADKMTITCKKHGVFYQTGICHLRGAGCPECGQEIINQKLNTPFEEFVKKAREIHGNKYQYSEKSYINRKNKLKILCPVHGWFEQTGNDHLSGHGCPTCGRIKCDSNRRLDIMELIKKFNEIHHGKYDYSLVEYKKKQAKIKIICPIHGEFMQTAENHLNGCGCPKCALIESGLSRRMTFEEFCKRASERHSNKYTYFNSENFSIQDKIKISCPEHGIFYQTGVSHLAGNGCPKCNSCSSLKEISLRKIIEELICEDVCNNNRKILEGFELDILIESLKTAVEFNGIYWHNELFVDSNYHLFKTIKCNSKGYNLFHFFEDEFDNKIDVIKTKLLYCSDKLTNKIHARKCIFKEISIEESLKFFNDNSLEFITKIDKAYGLFFNDSLVYCGIINSGVLTCCSKNYTVVVGGLSKMIKHSKPLNISFNKRFHNGKSLEKLGFEESFHELPNYFYIKRNDEKRMSEEDILEEYFYPGFGDKHEFCNSLEYFRIYDCGKLVFCFKKSHNIF